MTEEDHLIKAVLNMGLRHAESQQEEMIQFLGMVQRFAELLPGRSGINQICIDLVRIIIEETNFDNCSIVLWDGDRKCLRLAAAFGLGDLLEGEHSYPYHKDLWFASGEGIAGLVFRNRQPMFLEGAVDDSIPVKEEAVVQPVSLACLPLSDLGVLNLSSEEPLAFSPQQKRNWQLLSKIITCLIKEASLQGQPLVPCKPFEERRRLKPQSSEQQKAEIDSVARLSEQVIDRTPQGICLLDIHGNVIRINRSLERLHGESASQVVGRTPAVLFRDPGVFEALLRKVTEQNQVESTDLALVNSRGEVYSADVSLVALASKEHSARGYLLVINDMTKKKASAEKVLQTEKLAALGTMAGGVAHDFNNLLMSILGNVQLIIPRVTDEEIRRRLKNVEKAVHEGADTVRRLQKFTKRDKDAELSQTITVNVSEVISEVLEITRPRWKNAMEKHGRSIEFKLELEPHCFAAMHPFDFREVLTNLVFNAIEAMPEGGVVSIRSKSAEDFVVIEVADTGIGMSDQVTAKIFDPFYTTKGISNSGLGLSVSWSLVGRAGGEIKSTSKPGKGSVLTVRLPKAEDRQKYQESQYTAKRRSSYRILLVDENIGVLGTLRDMLRLKGHWVLAVHDGAEALDVMGRERFDIVFTDQGLRTVSGWDIAKKMKEKNPHVPVVLLTSGEIRYEPEELSARGVDLVLSKPLGWESLLQAMETLFGSPESAPEDTASNEQSKEQLLPP